MIEQKSNDSQNLPQKQCAICINCGKCQKGSAKPDRLFHSAISLIQQQPTGARYANYLAVADIGTTTLAFVLYDNFGRMVDHTTSLNPQVSYGGDVMSRILAAQNPNAAGIMKKMITVLILQAMQRFAQITTQSISLVIAANTVMTYLLMGWDVKELGQSPYLCARMQEELLQGEIRFQSESINGVVMPGFSAFIGGDIYAGILATNMERQKEWSLLIDLGTNGEMVLGNQNKLWAVSVAAGSAFDTTDLWGTQKTELIAQLLLKKLIDPTGALADPWFHMGIQVGGATITQKEIRSLQLSKAAVRAGLDLLFHTVGSIPEDQVEHVVLAGGFGYHLQPSSAVGIGMLSATLARKATAMGNTALAGGYLFGRRRQLLGVQDMMRSYQHLSNRISTLPLAEFPEFEQTYLSHLNFPSS
ncbi:MAG: ASKHA domain-containing protein [Lachnospiraceae bacterium]|jgi:uncharacterized 2Fe-2S/4Fe-4S cluster protein (DUF4445 family)|nr:ASKHA domain-containing protein [Lachnospiraceae bacterium]